MTPDGLIKLRSPREASNTFSLSGAMAPRPKNLFYVSFAKSGSVSPWQRTIGFIAKSVERPGAQVQTEELNQYNKRRIVNTGIKHNPIRLQFYDTIDSQAVQMWDEYAKQYFGDYRHDGYGYDFQSDIINNQWNDNAGGGFGFSPYAVQPYVTDNNAQFFLTCVSVYQVYGGNYVQFDLYNPKIVNFEMDGLSYDSSDVSLINMQIAYEAVINVNAAVPQPISASSLLSAVFQQPNMDGDVLDYPNAQPAMAFSSLQTPEATTAQYYQPLTYATSADVLSNSAGSVGVGPLSAFGNYNFGSLSQAQQSAVGTEISALAAQNPQLAAALNLTSTAGGSAPVSNALINPYNTQAGINTQAFSVALALAAKAAGSGLAASGINLAAALLAAALGTNQTAAGGAGTGGGGAVVNAGSAPAGPSAPAGSTGPTGSSAGPTGSDTTTPAGPTGSDTTTPAGPTGSDTALPPAPTIADPTVPVQSDIGGNGANPTSAVYANLNGAGDATMQYGYNNTPQLSSYTNIYGDLPGAGSFPTPQLTGAPSESMLAQSVDGQVSVGDMTPQQAAALNAESPDTAIAQQALIDAPYGNLPSNNVFDASGDATLNAALSQANEHYDNTAGSGSGSGQDSYTPSDSLAYNPASTQDNSSLSAANPSDTQLYDNSGDGAYAAPPVDSSGFSGGDSSGGDSSGGDGGG